MDPLITGGIFLVVLIVGGGAAYAYISNRQNNVEERLEELVTDTTFMPQEDAPKRAKIDFRDTLDKLVANRFSFSDAIRIRISRADLQLRVSEYMAFVAGSGVVGMIIANYFLHGNIIMIVVGGLVGLRFPKFYAGMRANKRQKLFNNQLGDTINLWVNALRSGYSVLQGMEAIATELAPPVSREFERVVQEVRLGLSLSDGLNNMLKRVPSEDLDLVITAVNIQREVGGNLAEILDIISYTIRERVRIKGEIQTLTSQGRLSGVVISLLPIILGLVLYGIDSEYMGEIFVKSAPWLIPGAFPCGWCLIGGILGMIGVGGAAIQKIVDIEV